MVVGVNGAWRDVLLPLQRGRTMARAVADACALFAGPDDIDVGPGGGYGGTVDTLDGAGTIIAEGHAETGEANGESGEAVGYGNDQGQD